MLTHEPLLPPLLCTFDMPFETLPEPLLLDALLLEVPVVAAALELEEPASLLALLAVLGVAVVAAVVEPAEFVDLLPLVVAALAWLLVCAIWCTSSPKPAADAAITPETAYRIFVPRALRGALWGPRLLFMATTMPSRSGGSLEIVCTKSVRRGQHGLATR